MILLSLLIFATRAYHIDHYVAHIPFFKATLRCSCILELFRVPESQVASQIFPNRFHQNFQNNLTLLQL